ncbi:alpha/beta fold hydrolase [Nonomuraea sp. NPDC050451]|uniref:alpha/beta fold hydrolase n=1 Tax=Nonomuraea sp. NPDC050451 TaxID=3364364 RepID=UPI0037941E78
MTTRFTSFDGTELAYETLGDGPPLLLVPGGPRASAYLEDLGGLGATRTLIRYDARGTGESDVPGDPATYAYPSLADDVEALRAELGLERLDLLAHSSGTVVALAYAAARPERVARLVLVGPGPDLFGAGGEDIADILAKRADAPWYDEVSAAARELVTLGPGADPERVFDVLSRYTPAGYGEWDERQREHAAAQLKGFSLTAWSGFWAAGTGPEAVLGRLSEVSGPVLVVTGERDGLTGVVAGDVAAGYFPDARHITLGGAGHFPWVDRPGQFAAAVEGFLAAVQPAGSKASTSVSG